MKNLILGIDPGESGGFAILNCDGCVHMVQAMGKLTPADRCDIIRKFTPEICKAYIEKVGVMPKQGIVSAATFMRNYGQLEGFLVGCQTPYEFILPAAWQKALGCLTKGDKNITKARAQGLFPHIQVTHALADALLIAEYGRRREIGI